LNLEVNGVTNVELRRGSLFEPVAGERFDLIVSNPPFIVSPDTEIVFRDAGLERDEVSRLVARGAAAQLEPGGFASMLICWAHDADADWAETVRAWLAGAGCDAWLVRYATEDPLEYALRWAGAEASARWVEYYRSASIGALTTAGLVLRKRAGGDGWLEVADAESGPTGPAGAQIERIFAARDFAGDLADERLRLAPHALDERLSWIDGGYRAAHLTARLDEGAGVAVAIDPQALRALFVLDGSTAVRDLPDATAALPTIRRLFEAGFVERETDRSRSVRRP
jgi:hypothetical protein